MREAVKRLRPRSTHVHIDPADEGADARDRIVWDRLSDQPHQHAGRLTKLRVRAADAWSHVGMAAVVGRSLPASWRRYRALQASGPTLPIDWPEPGIALSGDRPWEEICELLAELGTRRVLLRVQPWDDMAPAQELARRLSEGGYELAYAVPQNRDLVRDAGAWRSALEEFAERFLPFSGDVQVGHAINRSKWGIWNWEEYERLMATASDVLRGHEGVRIVGPAVIDFEFHQLAMVLNESHPALDYDVVSSLLYVDRRGAPENSQMGFDTVGKVQLMKAIVETSKHGDRPCWVTEVNWPLREGPHSPAGRAVSVDEESQADFLVRYYLLAQGTGLVERVYWWQLVSRGYGLVSVDDEGLRRRSAHTALARLVDELAGHRLVEITADSSGGHRYLFERDGRRRAVVWSAAEPQRVDLGGEALAARSRDGETVTVGGASIEAGSSPIYVDLAG